MLLEGLGDLDGALAGGGVGDENGFLGGEGGADLLELVEEGLIEVEASGGIEDEDLDAVLLGLGAGAGDDLDRVFFLGPAVDGEVEALAEDLELLHGGGAGEIARDQGDALALALEAEAELGGGGGFAGAVQADEEEAEGAVGDDGGVAAGEELDQFVVEDFYELLAGLDALEDFLAEAALLDLVADFLGDLVVDVGGEEGEADFADGLGDVALGELAVAAEVFEDGFEFVLEEFEHGCEGRTLAYRETGITYKERGAGDDDFKQWRRRGRCGEARIGRSRGCRGGGRG